jgi:hypothetical protein
VTPRNFSSSFLLRWSNILASTILVAKFSEYYIKQNIGMLHNIWHYTENTVGTRWLWAQASDVICCHKTEWKEITYITWRWSHSPSLKVEIWNVNIKYSNN